MHTRNGICNGNANSNGGSNDFHHSSNSSHGGWSDREPQRKPLAACLAWALALAGAATSAGAQAPAPAGAGRISEVLVYPGGATVQRVLRVAAGASQVQLNCLPASLVPDSLSLAADAGIALGDLSLQTLDRAAAPECSASPLDARIRELEDQKAGLQAEHAAQELLLTALKAPPAGGLATGTAGLAAYADALRRTAQEALQRQHALTRRQQALDEQLAPLVAERDRQGRGQGQVRQLTLRLAAPQGGELRLSYRVPRAGWTPLYRAQLDTTSGQLRLERLAQVAQSTGEDWTGVRMRLSTTVPSQATQPRPPRPWTLDPQAPLPAPAPAPLAAVGGPARVELRKEVAAASKASFEVTAIEGNFATEYELPGAVRLQSDGQQATYVLDAGVPQAAQVLTRVQPQQEAQGYLVAEIPRPAGDWPGGPLQLYRDGAFVGQSRLSLGSLPTLAIGFGRDDRLRVEVAPMQLGGAQTGFFGNRAERREQHRYTVENRGRQPILVQVLEPTPVPQHDDIRIEAKFSPELQPGLWQDQPGIRVWQWRLTAGQTTTLSADYLISHPREMRVFERR